MRRSVAISNRKLDVPGEKIGEHGRRLLAHSILIAVMLEDLKLRQPGREQFVALRVVLKSDFRKSQCEDVVIEPFGLDVGRSRLKAGR